MPGKKGSKKKDNLGRALLRGQKREKMSRRAAVKRREQEISTLAALGIDDGNKMTSVTETNSLEDFLSNAVLANRDFEAVRDVEVVDQSATSSFTEIDFGPDGPKDQMTKLPIPRRPKWTTDTTPQELDQAEKLAFLDWRRGIARAEEQYRKFKVSPFEKNLEFWRQLWRVVERSDVLVQVVDSRNPNTFRCEDLEKYTKETAEYKNCVLLLNKADYLTSEQREEWSKYLSDNNVNHLFFSATKEQAILDEVARGETRVLHSTYDLDSDKKGSKYGSPRVLNRQELINRLSNLAKDVAKVRVQVKPASKNFGATVGFSGYPNVGKSSVINVLKGVSVYAHDTQRVSVASTPGHTKHFQTMKLTEDVTLCDSPGLVFPSFFSSKAEMLCNGILPIDEIRGRDFVPAIDYVCARVPRRLIEEVYNIRIAILPSIQYSKAEPLLEAFCRSRGLLGKSGRLDESRGARLLLKDYVSGKLLYVNAPGENLSLQVPEKEDETIPQSASSEAPIVPNDAETVPMSNSEPVAPLSTMSEIDISQLDLTPEDLNPEDNAYGVKLSVEQPINLDDDIAGTADVAEAVEFMTEQGNLDIYNPSRRQKKHGRKHKKGRDKDPYGRKGLGLDYSTSVHMKKPY